MSALTDEISAPVVIHAKWLKQFGSWNTKRTRATTNIFCVPNNLLCGIINKNAISISEATVPYQLRPDVEEKGRTCRACKLTFLEQCDQQQHFKTELHRINLKRNLVGLEPLEKITAEAPSGSSSDSTIVTRGVHFADEKKPGDSSSDEEEEEEIDHIYSPADYFDDEMIESDSSAARNPIEYVTPEGVARKHLSKQDGPQYVFSSNKESLSTWDFSVSVGALHEASNVSTFDVQPWTLLAETIQTLQGSDAL